MRDEFADIQRRDPMVCYQPKNDAARAFHASKAFIRYFRAGNRTSKTQSGYAEHYFVATGQHRWRYFPDAPNSTFILPGLTFSQYEGKVWEKKMFTGEEDNPLSPMFPENGKWFHWYNQKNRTLFLGCKECAEKGKAQSCPSHHLKSQITLLSPEHGVGSVEAFVVRLAHVDEHVAEPFFNAIKQRLASAEHSSLIITATPLKGLESWENQILVEHIIKGPPKDNVDEQGNPVAELFEIDQFSAGIVPHWKIRRDMKTMDPFEIEARVYGRPAPLAKNPVFDRQKLASLRERAKAPEFYSPRAKKSLEDVLEPHDIELVKENPLQPASWTGLRVWELPQPGAQYMIGADAASGLAPARVGRIPDASCASILKLEMREGRLKLTLVGQYHGWINPLDYGTELFKTAVAYNSALVVVELTGGHGRATVHRLKELAYWNIFRDTNVPEVVEFGQDARFGVDTNASTKPMMVGALQYLIKDDLIEIPCGETIKELVAFEQQDTSTTNTELQVKKYKGAGSKDDRVMSLCIAAMVTISHPLLFDFEAESANIRKKEVYD